MLVDQFEEWSYICIMAQVYKYAKSPKHASAREEPIDKLLNAELFKALGDPTRLLLLSCLAKCGRPCSVTEVSQCCSVDFSVVSRHLAILARANVIQSSKSGRVVSYQVRYKEISAALRDLARAFEGCCAPSAKGGCCEQK